ncbi:MAG: TetR/AcrR family transcriptional regulator [Verrucomicrobiales bacterium]
MTSSLSPTPADTGTADRILDAAEELFAARGFEKVSLRHLTRAAGVNLAAVNYHFGSKDALIDAVVERYVTPINEERLVRLTEAEQRHGRPVPLRPILEAFIRPFLTRIHRSEFSHRLFFKLMGRCIGDPDYRLPESTMPLFQEVVQRYSCALGLAAPHLPENVVFWRLHFTFGTLAHALIHEETLDQISGGRSGRPTPDELLEQIILFCSAGFDAPPTPEPPTA